MKKFAFTLAAALLTSPAFAQIEVGAGIGASIFTGDLGGSQYNYAFNPMDIDVMSTRLAGQAFVRVPLNSNLNFRANLSAAQVAGSDAYAGNQGIKARGASFTGTVAEYSARVEVYPSVFHDWYGYVGLGRSLYSYNTQLNGENLQSGPMLSNGAWSAPIGIGFTIRDQFNGAHWDVEVSTRVVGSDNLDGISGPSSRQNDSYHSITLNYSLPIGAAGTQKGYHRPHNKGGKSPKCYQF
ncbi:MAG: hypothetical protein RL577_1650 [Bacteroidota bacterium]|jgi:hypothetical protein